jgi:hypothetical protein
VIYGFLADNQPFLQRIIKVIGADLKGSEWCVCNCGKCKPKPEAGIDEANRMRSRAEALLREYAEEQAKKSARNHGGKTPRKSNYIHAQGGRGGGSKGA